MLKLKVLKFGNIRRFVGEQTIDFLSRESMIQFDGKNLNTGGSSGSGKSTIAMAIDYLFGVNEVSASALQSFLTKEGIFVEGIFDRFGKEIIINRSKKNGLSITIDGEAISGSSKLSEEKLDEIIGMEREIFRKTYHKRQKEGGFFLEMTPKQMYDFLSDVLNLNQWTSKSPIIDQQIKDLEKNLVIVNTEKQNFESSLNNFNDLIQNLIQPQKDFDDSNIDELKAKSSDLLKKIENLKKEQEKSLLEIEIPVKSESNPDLRELARLTSLSNDIKSSISALKDEGFAKLGAMRNSLLELTKQFDNNNRQLETVPTLQKQKNALEKEKEHIESMRCPTCTQVWVGDSAKQKADLLQDDISKLTLKIQEINEKAKSNNDLSETIARLKIIISNKEKEDSTLDLKQQLENVQSSLAKEELLNKQFKEKQEMDYQIDLSRYKEKCQKLKDQYLEEIQRASTEKTDYDNAIREISIKTSNYANLLASYESNKANLEKFQKEANNNYVKSLKTISDLESKIVVAQETKRFIKSYVTKIFQDCLEEIGQKASTILSNIPNMQNANIYFETAKETKEGKIKEEVTGIINMDGENEFPIKSLSGGERTAIDLAVDFAVIDLIESRSGKGADLFILDEPFNGLDSVSSVAVVDLLKTLDTNKRVVIIDHNAETKEVISDVITVVRDGAESNVLL